MTYMNVVRALTAEVGASLREHGFYAAFKNAPSFFLLRECEVDKARREVSENLGLSRKRKKKNVLLTPPPPVRRFNQITLPR